MKKSELLAKVKAEKPSPFPDAKLVQFLNEVEQDVREQLNMFPSELEPYTTAEDATLLAPDPYSRLYVSYLKAQIDYALEEYASYQLNQEQHSQDFRDYIDFIVRRDQAKRDFFPSHFVNTF